MCPRVVTNGVALLCFACDELRICGGVLPDEEERDMDTLWLQLVKQRGGVWAWPVIEGERNAFELSAIDSGIYARCGGG